MGACGSSSKEEALKEEERKRAAYAAKQRRKLSLAPEKVAEIEGKYDRGNAANDSGAVAVRRTSLAQGTTSGGKTLHTPVSAQLSQTGVVPYSNRKVNQDRAIVKLNMKRDPGTHLFAVMDGHGEFGHLVSSFVQDQLPLSLEMCPDLNSNPKDAILKATADVVQRLEMGNIQLAFSGTTLVYGLLVDAMLYVANVGDSRAILCRRTNNPKVCKAIPLSFDHKPENPGEKERILAKKGRVAPLPGPPGEDCGPPRVWLADVDVPGLAMSRSIGDAVSQTVGVISIPEIIQHKVTKEDELLVLASDGVWEFIDNDEVASMVWSMQHDLQAAVKMIVAESTAKWQAEEEVIDDITCVIVKLEYKEDGNAEIVDSAQVQIKV